MGMRSTILRRLQRGSVVTLPPKLPAITLPNFYTLANGQTQRFSTLYNPTDDIGSDFVGLVQGAYKANGVVFAVELARRMLFMQARFQWRRMHSGRPGELFGTSELDVLETPWPNGTTGDLLARMLDFADFGGDAFVVRRGSRLRVLRPDWTVVVSGSIDDPEMQATDVDADELGILYFPGGRFGDKPTVFLSAAANNGLSQYAHFMPIPDPLAVNRGMSWLLPIIREIESDNAMTGHKRKFFENGATVNLVVTGVPGNTPDQFADWVAKFEGAHRGNENAYKTVYLNGGVAMEKLGATFQEADLRAVQGAGEVRICIAAGVPAGVVGVSEGLQGSTLNSGNYGNVMRRFADLTMRPLWQNAAGSLQAITTRPKGAQLWYDDRDIPALKDDIKDAADVRYKDSQTIRNLTDAGFKPDAAIEYVVSGDPASLKGKHTGLYSVQLQKPQTEDPAPEPPDPMPDDMPPPGGKQPPMKDPPKGGSSDSGGPA